MPPKKRPLVGRITAGVKKARSLRASETSDQHNDRLTRQRTRQADLRATETRDESASRLTQQRTRQAELRAAETDVERDDRLQNDRMRRIRIMQERRHSNLNLEAFRYDPNCDYGSHTKVVIGGMNTICDHCQARRYKSEPPGMCCNSGKVTLQRLTSPPEPLGFYLSGNTAESTHFLTNIRKYNSCFQMTSFGSTIVDEGGFMPTFKVQGQIYHRVGSLLPFPDETPKFLQIYFVGDEETEADRRCGIVRDVRRYIVLNIQRLLHQHNILIKDFKAALDRMPTDDSRIVIRADKTPAGEHERRFNAPTTSEVAIVIVGEQFERRDIVLLRRSGALQRIAETHRSYDALQYPIMFWDGQDGYHFNLRQTNPQTGQPTGKKVSAMDFYAYRIMIRQDSPNHILQCRQLFHQYIVDMYAKIESERLLYIRHHQQQLRADGYIHLRDAIANDGNTTDVGKMVILPATFTGSPRHMHEYAQDAMSYVRTYGRPDLFITFTCNPAWTEIKDELLAGQVPSDRHDLTARVFKQKLTKLMDAVTKSHIFGDTRCWMYSIEWQKRGLPHAHILIWLKEKIRPTQIDNIISAELPNPEEDPALFEVVSKNMIHGPCGTLNPKSPCMREKKCTKRYPREMIPETQTGDDGYPLYRRRKPGHGGHSTTTKSNIGGQNREIEVDNRWVVPYCPLLSKMFKAHINVEYCNSVKSIKYICKYVNKGSDMAVFTVEKDNWDEISQYQTGRYISSNEAVWRILSFPIHERHPTVVHLSVHLENGQRVYFTADNVRDRAENPPNTTLTAFFLLCQEVPFARTLLYAEVPKYYTWNTSRKIFCKRKQGAIVPGYDVRESDALGRVYTVHPTNAECFYLRLLLHTVRGPTSFASLKTVDGQVCETYREACLKRGLLEDDEHWNTALSEAALTRLPPQIRDLFAIIITTCAPSNPMRLWDKYKESLSEDILARHRRANPDLNLNFTADIFNEALILLEDKCISISGKTLIQLGLQPPVRLGVDVLNREILQEKRYDTEELKTFVNTNKPLLNNEQRLAFDTIIDRISGENGGLFFLDASGGTGKSFVINLLLAEIRSRGEIALGIASSGIASTLLVGGRTAHSALQLPLNLAQTETPVCNVGRGSGRAKVLQSAKVIIWDECTMAHKRALEALDRLMKDLRRNSRLMGGTVVVLAGDFRQTLPVIKRGTSADELNACLKSSHLWGYVERLTLSTNMRVQLLGDDTAQKFAKQLLDIGNSKIPIDPATGLISLPTDFCNIMPTVDDMIQKVFPDISTNFRRERWLCERAILASKNNMVNSINNQILDEIPGQAVTYKSIDTVVDNEQAVFYPTEFLNSLEPPGTPPHQLSLKPGAPIMLLRNLDAPKLCNGTRLCVTKLMPNIIEANLMTGSAQGENVFIPRIPIIPSDMPFDFKRLQFPVKLAFAITINKAQGQTLRVAGINLESPCFSHGQLYVACSRVGTPKDLYVFAPDGKTKNVVYPMALQ